MQNSAHLCVNLFHWRCAILAPMAASLGQKKLITPGILVGILGYVIGTFIGVSIAMTLN